MRRADPAAEAFGLDVRGEMAIRGVTLRRAVRDNCGVGAASELAVLVSLGLVLDLEIIWKLTLDPAP